MALVCRHVLVSGRVQGVGFRWHARAAAEDRSLTGWVKNLPDGRVEVWLEGEEPAVDSMVAWLRKGPSAARVEHVEVASREPAGCAGFDVRRGA